jgi:hypothetical protein
VGERDVKSLLLGSVSHGVINHATGPVAVGRAPLTATEGKAAHSLQGVPKFSRSASTACTREAWVRA